MEEALLLIQKIKAMYQSKAFSKSDQSIAEYILNDPGCLAGATANSLAEASGTSPATVIRFAASSASPASRSSRTAPPTTSSRPRAT